MRLSVLFVFFACVSTPSWAKMRNSRASRSGRSLFADVPSFPLYNAAESGLHLPAVGFGTGFYGQEIKPYGVYPECGSVPHGDPPAPPPPGCGPNTQRAVYTWLNTTGGIRIDCANSYFNQLYVARGIEQSSFNRSQLFILSKVGPPFALGYNETIRQTIGILDEFQTEYIDSLLIHWPVQSPGGASAGPKSSDAACNTTSPHTFNEKQCRLSTWSAMVDLFKLGLVRSIGVSNYNTTHLQEIIDAGLPLPSINQVSFNPYNYRTGRADLLKFCQKNRIQLLAYSPLGVPDVHQFPAQNPSGGATGMSRTLLEDPVVVSIAKTYSRTPAQVLLRWAYQLDVPSNPRSMNAAHMLENIEVFSKPFTLSSDDMARITNLAQDTCDVDSGWYECVGHGNLP